MMGNFGHFHAGYAKYTAVHEELIEPQHGTGGFDLGSNDA
jgi:hypothetical protein